MYMSRVLLLFSTSQSSKTVFMNTVKMKNSYLIEATLSRITLF
jgi:hypothetical protein